MHLSRLDAEPRRLRSVAWEEWIDADSARKAIVIKQCRMYGVRKTYAR